jgi:hypothetical protein
MMAKRIKRAVVSLAGLSAVALGAAMAGASPYVFSSGGGTYSYNTSPDLPASNAVTDANSTFYVDGPGGAGTDYYYAPTTLGIPGTVTFTFDAAPGEVFATGDSLGRFTTFISEGAYISEAVTTNLDPVAQTIVTETNSNGGNTDSYNQHSLTPYITGASTFSLSFTLYNDGNVNSLPNYTQLFREDYGTTTYPFVVDASSVLAPTPEPASLGLLGVSGLALLRRRRRV